MWSDGFAISAEKVVICEIIDQRKLSGSRSYDQRRGPPLRSEDSIEDDRSKNRVYGDNDNRNKPPVGNHKTGSEMLVRSLSKEERNSNRKDKRQGYGGGSPHHQIKAEKPPRMQNKEHVAPKQEDPPTQVSNCKFLLL